MVGSLCRVLVCSFAHCCQHLIAVVARGEVVVSYKWWRALAGGGLSSVEWTPDIGSLPSIGTCVFVRWLTVDCRVRRSLGLFFGLGFLLVGGQQTADSVLESFSDSRC